MTTIFSVHKQNVNTYGPITSSYDPTTQKTTIPISSSDVTLSGSETRTSHAPSQQHNVERVNNKRPITTTPPSVYTHKFPRHHFQFTWPFDEEGDDFSPTPKNPKNQKGSASEKKPQRVQSAKFAFGQGAATKTNSTTVPLYEDYSSAEAQSETQRQSSKEELQEEEEESTERSKPRKNIFYDFFHSDDSDEFTPKPKRQQKPKGKKEEESGEQEESKAKKAFYRNSKDDKFEDIPNPFADPNFDFSGYLQQLRTNEARRQQQRQQQLLQQQQRTPNESQDQKRIIYPNQAIPQRVYQPYNPTTLNPFVDYQTTYAADDTIKQLGSNPALPLVIRNALKNLNGPRGSIDQPYHSHTALKPVQTKPASPTVSPSYKSNERGPQTFKNTHILAYNVNTHRTAFKPGQSNNPKASAPKVQVKQVPVVATDDYYYYYYDDEPQQTQQVKAPSTNNKVEAVNKKPADDEYYYYEYYEYPDEKNKTKPNTLIRYDYVVPTQKINTANNKQSSRNPYTNPNSLPSQTRNTYKSPSNDNTSFFTSKPIHSPLTTTPYPPYAPKQRASYTTVKSVTTVKPTSSYARQRLTTTDRDSRRDQPIFYNR